MKIRCFSENICSFSVLVICGIICKFIVLICHNPCTNKKAEKCSEVNMCECSLIFSPCSLPRQYQMR